ncbi:hypothetical protein [Streptomyces sp. NPDC088358]|uniref:hypothetical protein n=1 Tax=Streptomyces sp. NPDC088358 TaxID=3365857 RepID=UPI00380332D1
MSRHRKGRRHRTVNMTPRPVGRAGAPRAVPPATAGREEVAAGRGTPPTDRGARVAGREEPAAGREEPNTGREAPATGGEGVRTAARAPLPEQNQGDEDHPAVLRRVRESGLSRHAVRTWEQLASAGVQGSGLDELCAAVGFQEATVLRHLKGLADQGLVVREESLWRAAGAGREPGAPEREEVPEAVVS